MKRDPCLSAGKLRFARHGGQAQDDKRIAFVAASGLGGVADYGLDEVDAVDGGGDAVEAAVDANGTERFGAGADEHGGDFGREREGQFQNGTGFDGRARQEVDAGAGDIAHLSSVRLNRTLGKEDLQR